MLRLKVKDLEINAIVSKLIQCEVKSILKFRSFAWKSRSLKNISNIQKKCKQKFEKYFLGLKRVWGISKTVICMVLNDVVYYQLMIVMHIIYQLLSILSIYLIFYQIVRFYHDFSNNTNNLFGPQRKKLRKEKR